MKAPQKFKDMSNFQAQVNEVKEIILGQKGNGGNGSHSLWLHSYNKKAVNTAIKTLLNEGKVKLHTGLSCETFTRIPSVESGDSKWLVNHFTKVLSTMNYSIYLV